MGPHKSWQEDEGLAFNQIKVRQIQIAATKEEAKLFPEFESKLQQETREDSEEEGEEEDSEYEDSQEEVEEDSEEKEEGEDEKRQTEVEGISQLHIQEDQTGYVVSQNQSTQSGGIQEEKPVRSPPSLLDCSKPSSCS